MRLHRLRSRIVAFYTVLSLLISIAGLGVMNFFINRNAQAQIAEELLIGDRVLRRTLSDKSHQLEQAAGVLAADFAFREAVATRDRDTLLSALENHGRRIHANLMMMIDPDGNLTANTLDEDATPGRFGYPALLERARATGRASGIVSTGDRLYQLVLVAVRAPAVIGWVAMGFAVNDSGARDLGALTSLQVSVLARAANNDWHLIATTIDKAAQPRLKTSLMPLLTAANDYSGRPTVIAKDLTLLAPLMIENGEPAVAVLQRSLHEALQPFDQLRNLLAALAALGLAATVLGSVAIARGITGPLSTLSDVARRIAKGDYSEPIAVTKQDEVGELAAALHHMRTDIATREATIMDLAYRDPLTRLPNRALFNERLQQAITSAKRSGTAISVLTLDLDNFNYVNNTLGHANGDLLLQQVALRIQSALLRQTDTLARLGGDEFAILLPAADLVGAREIANRVLKVLEAALSIEGHTVDVAASIGIVSCPQHGQEVLTLMSRVDLSMAVAKRNKSGFAEYDVSYDQSPERLSLLSELRQATENDELVLYYQPKLDIAAGQITYVEALLRWQHPRRGFVAPDEFIPFAEQTGYIRVITQWVLDTALKQTAAWRLRGLELNMCVNISARDLLNPDLTQHIARLLKRYGVNPDWIWLEITESAIMDDPIRAQQVIEELHNMGLHLSIDDFGTGYSSLAYLKRLPVDELKIDKSFVLNMNKDHDDAVIVRSTIDLGHNMDLKVVAEGVDCEETLQLLGELGCDIAQGYHICRPLAVDKFEQWLADFARAPRRAASRRMN
ncbi:MAG: EAL domain-containing protein [Gammaproteobacteria bacterium]|nr:EAL domain-containing protein [Gammaproteobacteria bacterium]